MRRINITGNVILDTDSILVSGTATVKSFNTTHILDLMVIGNQANFSLSTEHGELIKDGSYNVSIHCFDNENNTYTLSVDGISFKDIEDEVISSHTQYLVNSDCILNKDVLKLLHS